MRLQENTTAQPLAWTGSPVRGLLRLAWPVCVANLSYASMTLVDTLFVSRLGETALAGVGLGGICTMAIIGFGAGVMRGAKVVLSQARGAGRDEQAWVASAALLGAAVLAVVMALLGRGLVHLLPSFTASEASARHASTYVSIRTAGAFAPLAFVALREVRYGMGDTRTTMLVVLGGNVLNIVFDYVTIFHLGWGVHGAAWATVVAFSAKACVLFAVQHRAGLEFGRRSWRVLRDVLREGLPTGIHFTLDIGAAMVLCVLLASLSDRDMAAHQIGIQISAFAFLPAMALSEAATVLVGEAVGARRPSLVRGVARRTVVAAWLYAGMCSALLVAGAGLVVRLFTHDVDLVRVAVPVVLLVACQQLMDATASVGHGVLRGASDQRYSMLAAGASAWLCTLPLGWWLAVHERWGAPGAWTAMSAELAITSALLWWRVERGGWLGGALRRSAPARRAVAT